MEQFIIEAQKELFKVAGDSHNEDFNTKLNRQRIVLEKNITQAYTLGKEEGKREILSKYSSLFRGKRAYEDLLHAIIKMNAYSYNTIGSFTTPKT